MATNKHRPYLATNEIKYIVRATQVYNEDVILQARIVANLSVFIMRVEAGINKPAYVANGLGTVEGKLGMIASNPMDTPEAKRERAYNKWINNPASCTMEELELVDTYRADAGLMNETEEAAYYCKLMGAPS